MRRRTGIPTFYKGFRFRSRLEAIWAAMFDGLEWKWDYEPLDFNGYIPDFVLFFSEPLYVEVKPELGIADLEQYHEKIKESGCPNILIVGATIFESESWYKSGCFGLIDCEWANGDLDVAIFQRCEACKDYSLFCGYGTWACVKCGAYDGDQFIGPLSHTETFALWAKAKNTVQWRPAP